MAELNKGYTSGLKGYMEGLKFTGVKGAEAEAMILQYSVRESEREQRDMGINYSEEHVNQSIVHAREDMVLLISHLTTLNKTNNKIVNRLNFLIIILVSLIAAVYFL